MLPSTGFMSAPSLALIESCVKSDCTRLRTLLKLPFADPNAANNEGMTPLHCASFFGNLDAVELLLEHGADHGKPDDQGHLTVAPYSPPSDFVITVQTRLPSGATSTLPAVAAPVTLKSMLLELTRGGK